MSNSPVRVIDQTPPPDRFARGWHCLGLSRVFSDSLTSVTAFDTRLVIFRDSNGDAVALQSACPHMGGDLSGGTIDGDMVRCPYHHWGWGKDGRCLDIPYSKKIPKEAKIRSWPVMEQNKLLFIWNDPEGDAPDQNITIPKEAACFSDNWSDWVVEENIISINCRELIDNMSDKAHFGTVHGVPPTYFKNIFEGHTLTQLMQGRNEGATEYDEGGFMDSKATYFGPAYMLCWMTNEGGGIKHRSLQLVSHVPINKDSFVLRHGVMVEKIPSLSKKENNALVGQYTTMTQLAFKQDIDIWHSKIRVDNPLMSEGDGPVNKLREWYDQFYVDKKDVPTSLLTRFECEA